MGPSFSGVDGRRRHSGGHSRKLSTNEPPARTSSNSIVPNAALISATTATIAEPTRPVSSHSTIHMNSANPAHSQKGTASLKTDHQASASRLREQLTDWRERVLPELQHDMQTVRKFPTTYAKIKEGIQTREEKVSHTEGKSQKHKEAELNGLTVANSEARKVRDELFWVVAKILGHLPVWLNDNSLAAKDPEVMRVTMEVLKECKDTRDQYRQIIGSALEA